jgi:hypothetical protein
MALPPGVSFRFVAGVLRRKANLSSEKLQEWTRQERQPGVQSGAFLACIFASV